MFLKAPAIRSGYGSRGEDAGYHQQEGAELAALHFARTAVPRCRGGFHRCAISES